MGLKRTNGDSFATGDKLFESEQEAETFFNTEATAIENEFKSSFPQPPSATPQETQKLYEVLQHIRIHPNEQNNSPEDDDENE